MSLHVIFNVSCAEVGANKPAQVYVSPLPYRSGSLLRVFVPCFASCFSFCIVFLKY